MLASLSIFSFVPFVREKNFFLSYIFSKIRRIFFHNSLCVSHSLLLLRLLNFYYFFFCGRVDDESNAAVNGGRNSIEIHHVEFFYNTQYKYIFFLLRLQNVLIR